MSTYTPEIPKPTYETPTPQPTSETPAPKPTYKVPTPKADWEIEIDLDYLKEGKSYTFPVMKVKETVRYFSNQGEVTIHFTEHSPFRSDGATDTKVPGGVILTLVNPSDSLPSAFPSGCSVKDKNGKVWGWPDLKTAGADTHVHQP
jgi:hypothetical protein